MTWITKLAALGDFPGLKAKHVQSVYPDLAWEDVLAVHAARKRIDRLRADRAKVKRWEDPLVLAARLRPYRTPSALAARQADEAARQAERDAYCAWFDEELRKSEGIRSSLLSAARVARKMGFWVEKSTNRRGVVSSYYVHTKHTRLPIRISDHEIPSNPRRDFYAREFGQSQYDGYPGREIIINEPRSDTWLRRAILVATTRA